MNKEAIYALFIAFFLNIVISPFAIPILHHLKFGQNVRDDGPKAHLKKAGTPTMGGIVILLSFLLTGLFFLRERKIAQIILLITLGFGLIGFIDDYLKITRKNTLGLSAVQKLILQFIVAALGIWLLTDYVGINHKLIMPFTGGSRLNLGLLYWPFTIFTVVAIVNAVNLSDGIDGLATSITLLISTFFMSVALLTREEVTPIIAAMIGSLLGFLIFNCYPAKMFMGDTGSLALGGFIAAIACALQMPLFIVIVGLVYILETLSVILQVAYFKKTKKRLFRMAPIHHHLELIGWSEIKVVFIFSILTLIMCVIGFVAF